MARMRLVRGEGEELLAVCPYCDRTARPKGGRPAYCFCRSRRPEKTGRAPRQSARRPTAA